MTIIDHMRPNKPSKQKTSTMLHIKKPRPETMKRFTQVLLDAKTKAPMHYLPNRHELMKRTEVSYSTVCTLMAHLVYRDIVAVDGRTGTRIIDRAALKRIAETGELPVVTETKPD